MGIFDIHRMEKQVVVVGRHMVLLVVEHRMVQLGEVVVVHMA